MHTKIEVHAICEVKDSPYCLLSKQAVEALMARLPAYPCLWQLRALEAHSLGMQTPVD